MRLNKESQQKKIMNVCFFQLFFLLFVFLQILYAADYFSINFEFIVHN